MRQYVLIGSGPAGVAAAEAIRSLDSTGDLLLLTEDPYGYYSRPGLAYFLTGEIPENMLYPFHAREFDQLGVRRKHARVTRIAPKEHRIQLAGGESLSYDRLLIATGAYAARIDTPGSKLDGVVKLDSLEDARRIRKLARHARAAVVIGGGITALEITEGLVAQGVKTHYFLRGERYWTNVLDKTESRIVEGRLRLHGVQIHYHTEVAEILERRNRVAGVLTRDGRRIPCDLVAVAVGTRARKELAEASGIAVERGILVSETMQTSAVDVFAAGDAAQVFDPVSGKSVLDTLWSPARQQGYTAGLNMAGKAACYHKPVPFNVTRLADLTTTIIGNVGEGSDPDLQGIARGDSEIFRQLPEAIAAQADFEVNRLRVMVGRQTLLGAIVMGDQTLSQAVHQLVARRADISPVRDKLLRPEAPLGDILANFWIQWCKEHDDSKQS